MSLRTLIKYSSWWPHKPIVKATSNSTQERIAHDQTPQPDSFNKRLTVTSQAPRPNLKLQSTTHDAAYSQDNLTDQQLTWTALCVALSRAVTKVRTSFSLVRKRIRVYRCRKWKIIFSFLRKDNQHLQLRHLTNQKNVNSQWKYDKTNHLFSLPGMPNVTLEM